VMKRPRVRVVRKFIGQPVGRGELDVDVPFPDESQERLEIRVVHAPASRNVQHMINYDRISHEISRKVAATSLISRQSQNTCMTQPSSRIVLRKTSNTSSPTPRT